MRFAAPVAATTLIVVAFAFALWLAWRPATPQAKVRYTWFIACCFGLVAGLVVLVSVPAASKWLAVVLLLFALLYQFAALRESRKIKWRSTLATVTDVSVAPLTLNSVHVEYTFSHMDTQYSGSRYRIDEDDRSISPARENYWLRRYAEGTTITVWFDPGNPHMSVMERSSLFSLTLRLLGLLAMCIALSLHLMLGVRP